MDPKQGQFRPLMTSSAYLGSNLGINWTQSSREVGDGRRRDERSLVGGRTPLRAGRRRAPARLASTSSTRSRASAPSGCGSCCTPRTCVPALGAMTGGQAVQMVKAGLKAIYLSGWQVAADANLAGHTYPDQSLYPANSAPALVRRINNALLRADQIDARRGRRTAPTGSRRSSPTPRRASAVRSTRSSS